MNKKLIYAVFAFFISTSLNTHALDFALENTFKATQRAQENPWVFEFKNKMRDPLEITLKQKAFQKSGILDKISLLNDPIAKSKGDKEEQHGYLRFADSIDEFNPKEPTTIIIKRIHGDITNTITFEIARNDKRDTMYLTYSNSQLKAQEGTKGKTQSGLLLRNNVQNKDIKKITK